MKTSWVEPGLCMWDYVDRNYARDGGISRLDRMKAFLRMAGEIGAKYHILEGFAYGWSDAGIREFTGHSRQQGVRVLYWRHSKDLRTPDETLTVNLTDGGGFVGRFTQSGIKDREATNP